MAIVSTGDLNHQHFSASAGDTLVFTRPIVNIIINVPTGALITVDFDGSAAASGSAPLELAVGTHQLINILVKRIVFAGSGSVTGYNGNR